MLLPKVLDDLVKRFLQSKGYVWFRGGGDRAALARRAKVLTENKIDLVLDVGANCGQYGEAMRALGYNGRIYSFEPMADAWRELQHKVNADPFWEARQVALGDRAGHVALHVAGNSVSSSLLRMRLVHERSAPGSSFFRDETVQLCTLDSVLPGIRRGASGIWLKMDVQGFESKVLAGATESLPSIRFIQSELSLVELYDDQMTYLDMCRTLETRGFKLIGIEAGFTDSNTGALLQFDGIFARND